MPKFRFEFVDEPDVGPVTLELEDKAAAMHEARRAMAETVLDHVIDRKDPRGSATKIYDEAGYLIATVDFQDFLSNDEEASNSDPSI